MNIAKMRPGTPDRHREEALRFEQLREVAKQLDNSTRDTDPAPDRVDFSAQSDGGELISVGDFQVGQLVAKQDAHVLTLAVDGFTREESSEPHFTGTVRHLNEYCLNTRDDTLSLSLWSRSARRSRTDEVLITDYSVAREGQAGAFRT